MPVSSQMFVICDKGFIVPHISKLSTENFLRLWEACTAIIKMIKHIECTAGLKQEVHVYSNILFLFLDHLQHLLMTLEQVCLSVQEMQHVVCLLHVMADYMLIYKPQMDGYADESKV